MEVFTLHFTRLRVRSTSDTWHKFGTDDWLKYRARFADGAGQVSSPTSAFTTPRDFESFKANRMVCEQYCTNTGGLRRTWHSFALWAEFVHGVWTVNRHLHLCRWPSSRAGERSAAWARARGASSSSPTWSSTPSSTRISCAPSPSSYHLQLSPLSDTLALTTYCAATR